MVVVPRVGQIHGGGHLGHPDAQHAAGGAGRSRPHADEQTVRPRLHQLKALLTRDAVTDDDRDRHRFDELGEVQWLVQGGQVLERGDGGLDDEQVHPGLLGNCPEPLGVLRDRAHRARDLGLLDLLDPLRDELLVDRGLVELLNEVGGLPHIALDDLLDRFGRVVIAGLHPVEVEHRQPAELAHRDGKFHVDDAVHCRGDEGGAEPDPVNLPEGIDFGRIDGGRARYQRDLVKPITAPGAPSSTYPLSHQVSSSWVGKSYGN